MWGETIWGLNCKTTVFGGGIVSLEWLEGDERDDLGPITTALRQ